MNFYSIFPFTAGFLILLLGLFVYLKNRKSLIHNTFGLFSLSISVWLITYSIAYNFYNKNIIYTLFKIGYTAVIFIPITWYHFISSFLNLKRERKWIFLSYITGGVFAYILNNTNLFMDGLYKYFWGYYPRIGKIHPLYLLFVLIISFRYIYILFYHVINDKVIISPLQKMRIKYLLIATLVGNLVVVDFIPNYNIEIFPFGFLFITVFVIISTHAIIKYHLMDIKIALTRAGIFIFVYLFVLGIPFILGYRYSQWKLATYLTVFLASTGPFIYLYLKRQVENIILKEQHRYQKTLREFSKNLTYIHELDKLFQIIVSKIVEEVRVKFGAIYLKDDEYKFYKLKYCFPEKETFRFSQTLPLDDPLIETLYNKKIPILSDEINIKDKIKIDTGLFIPCFIEDNLLSFIVLGPKSNKQIYTNNDLIIFETLSYYISLAIENSLFFKKLEEQQRKARIQEMDIFSYSIAHEIDNPMTAIKLAAEYLKDNLLKELNLDKSQKEELEQLANSILTSQERVSGMVKAIEEFGKPAPKELLPLKLEEVINSYLALYLPIFKNNGIVFNKELPKDILYIRGIKQELMQVFVNLSNNSIHALLDKKEKKINLKVEVQDKDFIKISFSDNGYGISKDRLHLIFTPFVTTKASTEGKGMGLYIVKRIIEKHKGKIWAESEGKDKGATFYIELPIAKDLTEDDFKKRIDTKRIF